MSLFPNLKIGTTLAILRLSGKTPSHMHSFLTFDRRGASTYFDNFKARTGISSCPHDFLESNVPRLTPLLKEQLLVSQGMRKKQNVARQLLEAR